MSNSPVNVSAVILSAHLQTCRPVHQYTCTPVHLVTFSSTSCLAPRQRSSSCCHIITAKVQRERQEEQQLTLLRITARAHTHTHTLIYTHTQSEFLVSVVRRISSTVNQFSAADVLFLSRLILRFYGSSEQTPLKPSVSF